MANIYDVKEEPLHELLKRALAPQGCEILVPDLQRAFVWTPKQVILLVDSLFRGWPFGTLLLWSVHDHQLRDFPYRQFWAVYDGTAPGASHPLLAALSKDKYHMVLDGQQRLQSLLLAVGGDSFGIKLTDRVWGKELPDRGPLGNPGRTPNWSKAELAFDLDAFLQQWEKAGRRACNVDYVPVLEWVVSDHTNGRSPHTPPRGYERPLKDATQPENAGKYIRLSHIWNTAEPNLGLSDEQFKGILRELLPKWHVLPEKVEVLLRPMAEFLSMLERVKTARVAYLELAPYNKEQWPSLDVYNDAIVNIFTRLNSGGCPLTREEITFAWLKVNWHDKATDNKNASTCFDELQKWLASDGHLNIELDDLVGVVSIVWACAFNRGKLLSNSDLLRSTTVRPMAGDLSEKWDTLRSAVEDVMSMIVGHDMDYKDHYRSQNALAVLWTWRFLAARWLADHRTATTEPLRHRFEETVRTLLDEHVDRWLLCSQWTPEWTGSTTDAIMSHALKLATLSDKLAECDDLTAAEELLGSHLRDSVSGLQKEASNYINTLSVSSRDYVRAYYVPLWIWHRIDPARWNVSSLPLRDASRKKVRLDVDHVVAVEMWKRLLGGGDNSERLEALQDDINALGNCMLLEKNFNISKSERSLGSFLKQALKPGTGSLTPEQVAEGLGLDDAQMNPEEAEVENLQRLTRARTDVIRRELLEFVSGQRPRVDLHGPS